MGIRGIGILPMGVAVVAGRGARAPGGRVSPGAAGSHRVVRL
jgi:hypothetical protein